MKRISMTILTAAVTLVSVSSVNAQTPFPGGRMYHPAGMTRQVSPIGYQPVSSGPGCSNCGTSGSEYAAGFDEAWSGGSCEGGYCGTGGCDGGYGDFGTCDGGNCSTGNCGPQGCGLLRCGHCSTKAYPDSGWAPPVHYPVNRDAAWYQNYAPQVPYGSTGGGFVANYPQVYQPNDTTQLGYSYQQVPTWQPRPGMIPGPPIPSDYHSRTNPNAGGCNQCNSYGGGMAGWGGQGGVNDYSSTFSGWQPVSHIRHRRPSYLRSVFSNHGHSTYGTRGGSSLWW
ncbi:MAG: hypothetical protein ACK526_21975 [Planctomyces sp.]|jgi:hypothetical protein